MLKSNEAAPGREDGTAIVACRAKTPIAIQWARRDQRPAADEARA